MEYKDIILEKKKNIAILTLNRPSELNTLTIRTMNEIQDGIRELDDDDQIKVLIITGVGKVFMAGAELKYIRNISYLEGRKYLGKVVNLVNAIENFEKPVIAGINGHAMGGGMEFATACDFRIMSTEAKMGLSEINLGSFAGASATTRLPRIVGLAKAAELLFLGRTIDAEEAYRIGLVNKIVQPNKVMDAAIELASELAQKALYALRTAKAALIVGMSIDTVNARKYALDEMVLSFGTEDMKEGMKAFLEKRSPVYKGR